jgi:DNA-binding transcriptional MerR regulator
MYHIGLFSKISKTSVNTLKYYDHLGLLYPTYVDKKNGLSYYSMCQIHILHKIVSLRQLGFSINEVILIMDGESQIDILLEKIDSA